MGHTTRCDAINCSAHTTTVDNMRHPKTPLGCRFCRNCTANAKESYNFSHLRRGWKSMRQSRLINRHISISPVPFPVPLPLPLTLALQLQTAWQGGVNGLAGDLLFASFGSGSGSVQGEHLCASCDVSGVRISHMHRLSVGSSSSSSGRQQAAASQEGHSARTLTSQAVRSLRCCRCQ